MASVGGFTLGNALLAPGPPVQRGEITGPGVDIPHLAWPLRFIDRALGRVEQDGLEDVTQSVYAYLMTPKGSRPLSPDFGVEDPTFGPGVDGEALSADIEASEDNRAVVAVVITGPNQFGVQQITVQVDLPE